MRALVNLTYFLRVRIFGKIFFFENFAKKLENGIFEEFRVRLANGNAALELSRTCSIKFFSQVVKIVWFFFVILIKF